MRKKKYFGKRCLLNLPGHQSVAAIAAEIEDTSTWKKGKVFNGRDIKNRWDCVPHITFNVSDCNRSVELSLNINSDSEYENSIHKINAIIEAAEALRYGITIERQRYLDRISELPPNTEDEIES